MSTVDSNGTKHLSIDEQNKLRQIENEFRQITEKLSPADAGVEDIYVMDYKSDSRILKSYFLMPRGSKIQDAIERSKRHCTIMRYRFIHCSPMLMDLEVVEKRMSGVGM